MFPRQTILLTRYRVKLYFFYFECMQETGTHIPNSMLKGGLVQIVLMKDTVKITGADKAGKTSQNLGRKGGRKFRIYQSCKSTTIDSC